MPGPYPAIRPLLFALEPERAHRLALAMLRIAGKLAPDSALTPPSAAPAVLLGLTFPNRVGLAAGFDKDAIAVDGSGALGFGFLEVGTVTPLAQAGQAQPRLFRIPAAGALINRLGFPNAGAAACVARLAGRRYRGIVGVNIGKNATTPMDAAIGDYVAAFRTVRGVADYVAVNVSSPNTASLRDLQSPEQLRPLLAALAAERRRMQEQDGRHVPLLLKMAPDLDARAMLDVASITRDSGFDGLVATNTTLTRPLLPHGDMQPGGLSGRPLHTLALQAVARLRAHLGPEAVIIGVGGIDSPEAARAMRAAGADLVQLYTGLVYRGPALVRACVRALG